jgi:hypothetical protein
VRAAWSSPPLLVLSLVLAAATPAQSGPVVTREDVFTVSGPQRVRLEFPIGELHVEPSPDVRVHVALTLRCDDERMDCETRARRIEVVSVSRSGALVVRLDGWPPRWNPLGLDMTIRVKAPATRPLEVEMGVGDVDVRGRRADTSLLVGVGDASVAMDRAEPRRVRLESGVGRASLRRGDETIGGTGMVGHVVDWDPGKGRSDLRVKVGVGRIEVRLD